MISIRDAVPEDAEAIQQLNREVLGYDYSVDNTRKKLQRLSSMKGHKILVAEDQGQVIGYIHGEDYDLTYAPPMKNILGIAVAFSARRKGVGKRLLQAVENWARETGADGVRLVSGANRKEAHAFYRACLYGNEKQQINFKKFLE